jgi:hypothetical protein
MSVSDSELIVDIDSFERLYTIPVSTHTIGSHVRLTGPSGGETIDELVLIVLVRIMEFEAVTFLANYRRV